MFVISIFDDRANNRGQTHKCFESDINRARVQARQPKDRTKGARVEFCFELYGIRKCTSLIITGRFLEQQLGAIPGQFSERPPEVLGIINEPFAAGIIYPAVMGAWTFLAAMGSPKDINPQAIRCAASIFVVGLTLTLVFMFWLIKIDIPHMQSKLVTHSD